MRGEDTNTGSTTPCPGPTRSPRETSATSGLAGTCGGAVGGASTIGTAVGGAATLVGCASATLTSDEGWTGTRVGATGAGDGDSLVPARGVFAPASAAFCISLRRKASWRCASSWMVFASAGGADGGVGRGVIALSTAAVAGGAVTAAEGRGKDSGGDRLRRAPPRRFSRRRGSSGWRGGGLRGGLRLLRHGNLELRPGLFLCRPGGLGRGLRLARPRVPPGCLS